MCKPSVHVEGQSFTESHLAETGASLAWRVAEPYFKFGSQLSFKMSLKRIYLNFSEKQTIIFAEYCPVPHSAIKAEEIAKSL